MAAVIIREATNERQCWNWNFAPYLHQPTTAALLHLARRDKICAAFLSDTKTHKAHFSLFAVKIKTTMAKSSKRRQTSNGSAKKQLKRILSDANAPHSDPLAALPSAFLIVNLHKNTDEAAADDKTDAAPPKNNGIIHYYKSPLPPSILNQCLELFERNMGEMYRKSEWGLNMKEKETELMHEDARFLIILEQDETDNDERQTTPCNNSTAADKHTTAAKQPAASPKEVIGFANFRYEEDEDSPNNKHSPITYLYELQISPSHTSLGLGQTLMTILELLSFKLKMTKVVLTVFKCNIGAMKFYLKKLKGYEIDECSPSNFEGEENASADYEILSKSIGKK